MLSMRDRRLLSEDGAVVIEGRVSPTRGRNPKRKFREGVDHTTPKARVGHRKNLSPLLASRLPCRSLRGSSERRVPCADGPVVTPGYITSVEDLHDAITPGFST